MNLKEHLKSSAFPGDYDFAGTDPRVVMGMSVPPVMMAGIAGQIRAQWLEKYANETETPGTGRLD